MRAMVLGAAGMLGRDLVATAPPGVPRNTMPAVPFPGLLSFLAKTAIWSQVGCKGMVRPAALKIDLLYIVKLLSP